MQEAEKRPIYDPAEDLNSDEAVEIFMAEALKTGDSTYIAHARGVIERAIGTARPGVQER